MREIDPEDYREPSDPLQGAVALGVEAIEDEVVRLGGEVQEMVILVRTKGLEQGKNACSFGTPFEEPADLLAWVMGHFKAMAEELGLEVVFAPLGRG